MTDRYTKCVLTVIAVALTIIAGQETLKPASAIAQSGPVHVFIDGANAFAFQFAGPLAVKAQ